MIGAYCVEGINTFDLLLIVQLKKMKWVLSMKTGQARKRLKFSEGKWNLNGKSIQNIALNYQTALMHVDTSEGATI